MYLNQDIKFKKKKREFSRTYKIACIKVCREMFTHTLQVTTQKVNTSVKNAKRKFNKR